MVPRHPSLSFGVDARIVNQRRAPVPRALWFDVTSPANMHQTLRGAELAEPRVLYFRHLCSPVWLRTMGRPLLSKGDTSMSFPRRPRIFTRSQILLIAFLAFAFAVPTFAHAQTETTLFNFGPAAPANPYNGLTLDAAGNLYGVAYYSQAVYQLHRSNGAWQANVLYTFTKGKDGG